MEGWYESKKEKLLDSLKSNKIIYSHNFTINALTYVKTDKTLPFNSTSVSSDNTSSSSY